MKNPQEYSAFPHAIGCTGLTKLEYTATHIAAGFASDPNMPTPVIRNNAISLAKDILEACEHETT